MIEKKKRPKSTKYRPAQIRFTISEYDILAQQIATLHETVSGYVRRIMRLHIDEIMKKNLPENTER